MQWLFCICCLPYLVCACLHMYNICVSSYPCKLICLYILTLCFCVACFACHLVCACLHMYDRCMIPYTCKPLRLYMLLFCFSFVWFACPLFPARFCTCTTYTLSHTHVDVYVYTCCHFDVVLHVLIALIICALLHTYNTCIISCTCKRIRLYMLHFSILFCMVCLSSYFFARVSTCTAYAVFHTHVCIHIYM